MQSLKNNLLHINIKDKGAELCNITSAKHKTEFMWQANPEVWGGHAPNLFPIVSSMKDNSYIYDNKTYHMPKHGFASDNDNFKIKKQSDLSITFTLLSNEELYILYPFLFELEITYTLVENQLIIAHTVRNLDSKTIYFSLGGHPAFNCPLSNDEDYTDYYLEFEKEESSESYLINLNTGLLTTKTMPVFSEGNKINLRPDLFDKDALIFKDLKSRALSLKHKTKGNVLTVKFKDFPYLLIWAKPNAPYVCIEPWLGITDSETTDQKLETKEGIIKLEAGSTFNASYSIEIDQSHLV